MSDQSNGESGQHGFILGILVGILIALLFTTQKGRRLLKVISSEGAKKFGSIDDMLALLMRELGEDAGLVEEPVVGEDLEKEVKEIEPPKKEKKVEEVKDEKVLRPASQRGEAQDEKKSLEVEAEPEPEVVLAQEPEKLEKIDTEHLEQEIAELKEEIKEEKLEKIETEQSEEKIEEDPSAISGQDAPKKKSRRLFKGIRRK